MKKLVFCLMALVLILAVGATSFAYIDPPPSAAGHMGGDGLNIQKEGRYLFVNPFAAIKFGEIKPAVLEGDGQHITATGYVPFDLACNCAVKVNVTASKFVCEDDVAPHHGGDHYRGEGTYNIITPLLSANENGPYAASVQMSGFDEWAYEGLKVYFKVQAPVDQFKPIVLNNIDELHAGWYRGTLYFLVTQDDSTGEGHIGIMEPDGGHKELSEPWVADGLPEM
ncbi:MAG: hypothetical protein ACM3X9_08550 [Bacillota bacterium]